MLIPGLDMVAMVRLLNVLQSASAAEQQLFELQCFYSSLIPSDVRLLPQLVQ